MIVPVSRWLRVLSFMKWGLVLLIGCAATEPPPRSPARAQHDDTCKPELPLGDRSALTLTAKPGFTIAEPVVCNGNAYIRIERLAGTRPIDVRRGHGGGFDQGCLDLANPACLSLNVGSVLALVAAKLREQHLEVYGDGAGACARDLSGPYENWNMSIGTHDWSNANRIVGDVMDVLDHLDARGYVGVSVVASKCYVFD